MSFITAVTMTVFLLYIIPKNLSQENICQCERDIANTQWGEYVITNSPCLGRCDNATKLRYRLCYLPGRTNTLCLVTSNCANSASCEGQWSLWTAEGGCSTDCGTGRERLTRNCYKKNAQGNVPSKECARGYGAEEQSLYQPCIRRIGCRKSRPSIANTSKTTTTATARTSAMTTKTIENIMIMRTPNNTEQDIKGSEVDENENTVPVTSTDSMQMTSSPDRSPAGRSAINNLNIDTTTLAAILGSAALFCITFIGIFIIMIKLRKKNASSDDNDTTLTAAGGTVVENSRTNYEKVQLSSLTRNDGSSNSIEAITVNNTLYSYMDETFLQQPTTSDFAQSSSSPHLPYCDQGEETAYFSIDDSNLK